MGSLVSWWIFSRPVSAFPGLRQKLWLCDTWSIRDVLYSAYPIGDSGSTTRDARLVADDV